MLTYVVLVYGLLILVGGIVGYVKSRSLPSVFSGVLFGAALLFSSYLISRTHPIGLPLAAGLSAILLVIFALRFKVSRKFMPAGFLGAVS
ncbi:MAG: hypothetical protein D6743_03590, partial [Calditrichaeota bacterium]